MNRSFGTPLYPILGTANRPPIPTPFPSILPLLPVILPPLLIFAAYCFLARRKEKNAEYAAFIAMILAWTAGLLLVASTAGLESTARLSFPFALPAIIFSLAAFTALLDNRLARLPGPFGRIPPRWLATAILAGFAIVHIPDAFTLYVTLLPRDLGSGLRHEMIFDRQTLDDTNKLQGAAPPGAPIIARLAYPHLLDFQRNPIDIIDWPGGYYVTPTGNALFRRPRTAPPLPSLPQHPLCRLVLCQRGQLSPRPISPNVSTAPILSSAAPPKPLSTFNPIWSNCIASSRILYQDRQNVLFDLSLPGGSLTKRSCAAAIAQLRAPYRGLHS